MVIVIANAIDLVAALIQTISGSIKKKSKILAVQIVQLLLQAVSMLLLGGITGAVSNVLSCFRNYLCYKDKLNWAWKAILIAASVGMTVALNDQGLLGMLPETLKQEYQEFIMPNEDTEEYKIVKCADRLAAYLKCVEEIKAGNSEFKKAKISIGNELKSAKREEVDYYLKEFAPAFDLTLDELD